MENVEYKPITVIQFNDAQKAAMAAALMAVADEIVEPTSKVKNEKKKRPPLRVGDVIELTDSEDDGDNSDNSSDCEITGFVTLDTNEPIAEGVKLYPPVVKVEIKEELVRLPNAEVIEQLPALNSNDDQREEQFQEVQTTDVSVPQPLQIWQKEEQPLDMGEIVVEPETHEMPVITSVLTLMQPVLPNFASGSRADTLLEPLDNTNEADAAEDSKSSASAASSGEVFVPDDETLAAATFGTDQFAEEQPEYLDLDVDVDEDDSRYNCMDDDIIELNDSDDDNEEHMDEETEKKLIDLIESDEDEEKNTSQTDTPTEKTLANLIHYLCPECGHSCGSLRKWRGHLDEEHGFSNISKLNMRTIINKDGDLCHQCKTCHRKFGRNSYFVKLLTHCLKHLPFKDYMKCRLCDKRFTDRGGIRRHQLREHHKICKHYVGQSLRNSSRSIAFFCPVCGQQQKSRRRWATHLEDEHDYTASLDDKVKKCETTGQWECLTCARRFSERSKKSHMFLHEPHKPFRCKQTDCNFGSASISFFGNHARIKHQIGTLERPCMFCDEKFDTAHLRKLHMRDKHPRRLQKCHVCDKLFGTPSKLLSHMNTSNHQKLK